MKIIELQAENVKRLKAVEIRPSENLVQITGKNRQGKTSVLDSLWWAIEGAKHIQAEPIRKGADKAVIRLDLGDVVVTRTFNRSKTEGEFTTAVKVETADGARYPEPQKLLNDLVGALSLDPAAFQRMKPEDQFEALRRFVPTVDFDAIERANRDDFASRTDVNREKKSVDARIAAIVVPDDAPADRIDVDALAEELRAAGDKNAEIERRKARRDQVAAQSAARRVHADQTLADRISECEKLIAMLRKEQDEARAEADELDKKLADAEALPEPVDTTALAERLRQANATNAVVDLRDQRTALVKQSVSLGEKSAALTKAMEDRDEAMRKAIASAEMPVDGLGFQGRTVTLRGVPFDQASDAEQLEAAVAIAAAINPKLRVIRIRDGSLLDDDAMAVLRKFADEKDCQIWIERVDSSGKVGFVISDGEVVSPAPTAE